VFRGGTAESVPQWDVGRVAEEASDAREILERSSSDRLGQQFRRTLLQRRAAVRNARATLAEFERHEVRPLVGSHAAKVVVVS
jgi:hypothetical protein